MPLFLRLKRLLAAVVQPVLTAIAAALGVKRIANPILVVVPARAVGDYLHDIARPKRMLVGILFEIGA